MPLLTEGADQNGWVEPDDVPRPSVAYGIEMTKLGVIELAAHRHAKGPIMFVQRGALSYEVEGGLWIVPPRSALWIPGGALHPIKVTGVLAGYDAFMDPAMTAQLPTTCYAVAVTPLLRELLARAATLPLLGKIKNYAHRGMAAYTPNADQCRACGVCAKACPERAIKLVQADEAGGLSRCPLCRTTVPTHDAKTGEASCQPDTFVPVCPLSSHVRRGRTTLCDCRRDPAGRNARDNRGER